MIKVQDLAKSYGSKRALGPVSFEIEDGETVGFLGLNGSGKTTALRILASDLRPSAGTVRVENVDAVATPYDIRKRIGFLPEVPPLYDDMTVSDYLLFAGRLRAMKPTEVKRRLPEVCKITHLEDAQHEFIRSLSHGYRQRVGLAQAIIHNPKLLILDEPTRGLDPVQIVEMRGMIQSLKESHTVLISSHLLTEISQTCDRLMVLDDGKIIASGTEEALSEKLLESNRAIVVARAGGGSRDDASGALSQVLENVAGVGEVKLRGPDQGGFLFEIVASQDVRADVCRALVQAGHDVLRVDQAHTELENIFLNLVRGSHHARN